MKKTPRRKQQRQIELSRERLRMLTAADTAPGSGNKTEDESTSNGCATVTSAPGW